MDQLPVDVSAPLAADERTDRSDSQTASQEDHSLLELWVEFKVLILDLEHLSWIPRAHRRHCLLEAGITDVHGEVHELILRGRCEGHVSHCILTGPVSSRSHEVRVHSGFEWHVGLREVISMHVIIFMCNMVESDGEEFRHTFGSGHCL